MYICKSKTKSGKHFISISKSVRDLETKKPKTILVKSYGTFDLTSVTGKKALAKAEYELKEMNKLDKASRGFTSFEDFILSIPQKQLSLHHKNIGYLPYLKIFNQLQLPAFFSNMVTDSKLSYSFSDMMFYQTLGRLFNPSSKLEVSSRKDDFLYGFSFVNTDNIYSSLDVFSAFNKHKSKELADGFDTLRDMELLLESVDQEAKQILEESIIDTSAKLEDQIEQYNTNFAENENKLFKHLNKHIDKMIPNRDMSLAFYDCTTYYFESFEEDRIRERGMSKDNKRNETQVVMGLLIDSSGIPISYRLFNGNKHELHTMEKVIDDVLHNYTIKDIIIVADRGLNSKANLEMIRSKGLNYIVGSKGSAVPHGLKENKFSSSWTMTSNKGDKYKTGYTTVMRKVIQNNKTHDELIIKKYSDLHKEREMIKQDKMITKAKKNIRDFTVNATTKAKSKYYKASDNPKEKINVEIDEEKIKQEQENFGYFYIVTNKTDMQPCDIMAAYRSLYKIEESFRILKTNLKARPVYHFKERRIRSHFLICYLALVIQRILEYKLLEEGITLSTHEIINGLSEFNIDEIDYKVDKLYMITDRLFKSKINKDLFKIKKNVLLRKEMQNIISKM